MVLGRRDDPRVPGPVFAAGGGGDALRGFDEPFLRGEQVLPGGESTGDGRGLLDGLRGEILTGALRRGDRNSADCRSGKYGSGRDGDAPPESAGSQR
jgi:hypothetical protein